LGLGGRGRHREQVLKGSGHRRKTVLEDERKNILRVKKSYKMTSGSWVTRVTGKTTWEGTGVTGAQREHRRGIGGGTLITLLKNRGLLRD